MAGVKIDLGSILGGIGDAAKGIRAAIVNDLPADKKIEMELRLVEMENRLLLAQVEVNKTEAQSGSAFLAGWRPMIGWVSACAIAYEFLLKPLLAACLRLAGNMTELPTTNIEQLLPLVVAMLGLGLYRTIEKIQSVQGKH